MKSTTQKIEAILTRLRESEDLHARGQDAAREEVQRGGISKLVPKLIDLSCNSDRVAAAISREMDMVLYPFNDLPSKVDYSNLPEVPAKVEIGADWLLCSNGIVYFTNPFDQELLNRQLDELQGQYLNIGVISRSKLIGQTDHSDDVGAQPGAVTQIDNAARAKVDELIRMAAKRNASDIHFEPQVADVLVRFRVDGDLTTIERLTHPDYENVANVLLMRGSKGTPGSFGQALDSMFVFPMPGNRKIKLRVGMVPVVLPEREELSPKFTLRLLGNRIDQIALNELGIPNTQQNDQLTKLKLLAERKHGLILVSGPTGSGKTTTLSAMQVEMRRIYPNRCYYTVEDPVEISIQGVNHVQVNPEADLTFSRAVKAFLRGDPDVIMVGEIRDVEVANQALTASVTGHLVLSTIHTNSAIECVLRLIDMGCDRFTVASALKASTSQRLVKKLCPQCSIEVDWNSLCDGSAEMLQARDNQLMKLRYSKAPETYADLDFYPKGAGAKVRVANPTGCPNCDRGYRGRMLVSELFVVSGVNADLIARGASLPAIKAQAVAEGFKEIWQHAMWMIASGFTSFDEVINSIGERESSASSNEQPSKLLSQAA